MGKLSVPSAQRRGAQLARRVQHTGKRWDCVLYVAERQRLEKFCVLFAQRKDARALHSGGKLIVRTDFVRVAGRWWLGKLIALFVERG